jgi:hypothetical protein
MNRSPSLLLLLAFACSGPEGKDGPGTDKGTTDDTTDGTEEHTGATTETDTEPPLPPASLVVNEIMPGNQSTINGPDGSSMPDWIELVNTGDEPFALERLQLRTDSGGFWEGKSRDGNVRPGEKFLIWFGDDQGGDGVWTGFAIDRENDELIVAVDGTTVVAEIPIDDVPNDVSLMRIPDLTGDFVLTALSTPGADNAETASATLNSADETWFGTSVVHRIDFTMTQQAYQQLSNYERPEVHTEVLIDGVYYPDVGLKLKGSASYAPMTGKPAFIVDMNEWVPGTRFRGLSAFKLHNGNVLDPTRCRDHLTYKLARAAGLMGPRVGYAEVYVGPLYYGIYMIVERHDQNFVEYFHPTQAETGVVMEPNEASGGGWGGGDFGTPGSSPADWNFEEGPVPPDPLTVESLLEVDRLAELPGNEERAEEMWDHLDRDLLLSYLAWENVAMHTDGYMAINNWRVYVDGDNHKVSLLPAGAEWTWDYAAPGLGQGFYSGRLGNWCTEVPSCRRDYAARLVEVANLVDDLALADEFVALSMFLDPYIDADPRYSGWATADDTRPITLGYLQSNPEAARTWAYGQYPELVP